MPTKTELKMLQALPLEIKVAKTKQRIREFVERFGEDGVYVSFSGGKDSTVLLHIVRSMYPDIEAVFIDTGLEYLEIKQFVKTFDNVTILRPKMRFDEVLKTHGYPLISKEVSHKIHDANTAKRNGRKTSYALQQFDGVYLSKNGKTNSVNVKKYKPLLDADFRISHKCCDVMKKNPTKKYEKATGKKPLIATMAEESMLRKNNWLHFGCNAFEANRQTSQPMSFWTEQDVLKYIKENKLPIASVYGDIVYKDADGYEYDNSMIGRKLYTTGCDRTGCVFCAFGCHLDKEPSRFQRLKETHPRQYEYCIGGGEYGEDGIWKPNNEGLGMGHVFDELNKIYGEGFIKYK